MGRFREVSKRSLLGVVLAMALGAVSFVNWVERGRFGVPEDGVVWTDTERGVSAAAVASDSPAARVGVRPGDILASIGGTAVGEALDVPRILFEIGAWSRTEYRIERDGGTERFSVVIGESVSRDATAGFLLALGWAYGALGLLVWWRSPANAATARFFAFCVASLAVYSLSATGQFDAFDRAVYWLDSWALLLMPALFLDFCSRFPSGSPSFRRLSRASYAAAVAVAAAHHAAAGGWVGGPDAGPGLVRFFESVPLALLAGNFVAGAVAVGRGVRGFENPLHQLQARWLLFGAVGAIAPFGALYAAPFLAGLSPGPNQSFSVFSLAILPVAICVALFRYRLADFEIAWRRATAAAAAGGALLAGAFGALQLVNAAVPGLDRFSPLLWLGSLALAAGLYRPLRNRVEGALEQRAFKDRYHERRTLSAFAAELATETDSERMIAAVAARLANTFQVERVAVLGPDGEPDQARPPYRLLHGHGLRAAEARGGLDMEFVAERALRDGGPVVILDPSAAGLPAPVAELGCRHFVACRLRGRTLAWIGLGPTRRGSGFLSSDDLALIDTLSGPFAIALENARLYASLQAKATQYQILKDYNENIVESLSVGIVVLDADGRVQSWNTQLELALHIARDEAVGRPLRELLPAPLVDAFDDCQDETGSGNAFKLRLRADEFPAEFRPGGAEASRERVVNLAVAPLVSRTFERIGRLMVLEDVTDRVEFEERVARADKLSSVGVLAAGVAHEVNTPLSVISSYAQTLAERFSKGSPEAGILGKMTEQTFRASEIVNSLLDFSRVSENSMAPSDLGAALDGTLDLLAPQFKQAGVTVERKHCGGATVLAGKGKLEQVFLNLCLNARDAMPAGGTLFVETRIADRAEGGQVVEAVIRDSGSGMEPEVLSRIFDPFYTTKDARRGTGLGLAVSYGIVREHSGSIAVESAPGEGTAFTLAFPLAERPVHA